SAGIACGVSRTLGGAAIRAVARRELAPGGDARETDHGAEIGGGAWVAATSDMIVWASAPQLRKWGASPPLRRAREIGARMERESFSLWASRAAPSRPGAASTRRAGLDLDEGPWSIRLAARDRPLRGEIAVMARRSRLEFGVSFETHPVLAETMRFS